MLPVVGLDRLTDDAVRVVFEVPAAERDGFRFAPGQHVTVRVELDGVEARRAYSLCAAPCGEDVAARLSIAVKELGPGGFGEIAAGKLGVGDLVDVLPPAGRFVLQEGPEHVGIVAGSGVTPVLAMAEVALARGDRFTLIYGNRTASSVMFLEELADLKDRYAERLMVLHVLSREPREAPLLTGRIDASRLPDLLAAVLKARPDTPYSCTGGVCGTCRAKIVHGEVAMAHDYALEPEEKADGFVLACQSRPLTPAVELDFDA